MQGKFLVFAPATEGSGRGARLVLVQIGLEKSSDFVQEGQIMKFQTEMFHANNLVTVRS